MLDPHLTYATTRRKDSVYPLGEDRKPRNLRFLPLVLSPDSGTHETDPTRYSV